MLQQRQKVESAETERRYKRIKVSIAIAMVGVPLLARIVSEECSSCYGEVVLELALCEICSTSLHLTLINNDASCGSHLGNMHSIASKFPTT
jgi:hypothetical protein